MTTRDAFEKHKKFFISTIEAFTEYNPILQQISLLEIGPKRQRIIDYREKYLIANPAGLSLACKAVHDYTVCHPNEDYLPFIKRLMQEIDWSKDAEIWQNNVVVHKDGKMSLTSSNKPFALAIQQIANELNVILDPQEQLEYI